MREMGWRRTVAAIRMRSQGLRKYLPSICNDCELMASLDSVSIAILLGAVLVMAGILSSLLALRFGAPLLLVFLFIGMIAGDSGPGQLRFDDVRATYLVGSVALALILFERGFKASARCWRPRWRWRRSACC